MSPLDFSLLFLSFCGGDEGNRTPDPLLAGQVLSQLSYTPTSSETFKIEQCFP